MATAEKSKHHDDDLDFVDAGATEVLDDSFVESDDDGVPIPRESGPVPRSPAAQSFGRAARMHRTEDRAETRLPREGGLIGGKYRVEGIHDRDALVVTLKASHVDLGQRVWVRYLLPRAVRRPDALGRFIRSARTVARMRSEHAARVLDVGRIRSGVPFVVMDDMQGWDLDEVLRVRGPLPVQEAVEYVLQAAEAVAEAHGLGLVHGSLRPSNLLLARRDDESPLIKVVGFELSEVVEWAMPPEALEGPRTASGFSTTLPYLAPEQIRSSDHLDERVDVWAMGAILHALLTGGPPFRAKTAAALLAAISADEPRHVGEVRADVAPDLEELVLRCLSKNPLERPQSISELVSGLTVFAPGDSFSLIERISKMPARGTRLPPLPVPPSRAMVPVARTQRSPAEKPAPAPRQSLALTALVAITASVIGTTAVILASHAGAPPAAAATALSPVAPPPVQIVTPAATTVVTPGAAVQTPARAEPPALRAEMRAAAEPARRAPRIESRPAAPPPAREATTTATSRDVAAAHDVTASAPAGTPKDLFDDTR